ncbi:hypothetical protein ACTQO9_07865, partial [Streptococcus pneumoniae]
SEYQKRKDEICPFSILAFLQPTTVDKEPENYGLIFCPNVNHLELLFNLFFLANVPVLIPVTVFNPL